MSEFIKFPSINQFRNVIKTIVTRAQYNGYDEIEDHPILDKGAEMPILAFSGTVKLHGTNAAICQDDKGDIWFQSRNNIITAENDNAGFASYMENNVGSANLMRLFEIVKFNNSLDNNYPISIYGEWCGGSIQKGVALNKLDKMFVIFAIKLGNEDSTWYDINHDGFNIDLPEHNIFNITHYNNFNAEIDFSNPKLIQNTLIDLTNEVEKSCPVAKSFGVDGIGEGIVWKCTTEGYESSDYWFKVKGEKHSVSKVKTLAAVDPEKVKSANKFVDLVVTENRLNQGIEFLKEQNKEIDQKSTGDFLKWFFSDVMKEEHDTLEASGLVTKDVSSLISKNAREWFFEYLDRI
jgi:hypothetical protein